jgi:hypothetical protein
MSTRRAALCGALLVVAIAASPQSSAAQAVISLDTANSFVRGSKSTIAVNLLVKSKPVSFHRFYVKIRCKELIDLTQSITEEKADEKGKKTTSSKPINVKREEVLFEKEIPIADAVGKEFAGGSTQTLKAELEIPDNLPPTARGKFSRIKWEAEAVGDVVKKLFDATSGVQEITVK